MGLLRSISRVAAYLDERRNNPLENPAVPLSSPALWQWLTGGEPTASGETVNEINALQISTVYVCVTFIAQAIASLPFEWWERISGGRERALETTMRLSVDARGLVYEIDPPDTQFARDLMVSMRRKDITGSSFAFTVKRDQWTDNPDGSITRRILEFDELYDVSPVTYPAYPASSSEARSAISLRGMPAEMRKRVKIRDLNVAGCECGCPECVDDDWRRQPLRHWAATAVLTCFLENRHENTFCIMRAWDRLVGSDASSGKRPGADNYLFGQPQDQRHIH